MAGAALHYSQLKLSNQVYHMNLHKTSGCPGWVEYLSRAKKRVLRIGTVKFKTPCDLKSQRLVEISLASAYQTRLEG